jgi:GntR family transcriptional regulator
VCRISGRTEGVRRRPFLADLSASDSQQGCGCDCRFSSRCVDTTTHLLYRLSYVNRTTAQKQLGEVNASPGGDSAPVSPIEFRLDATSGVPTYLQLVQQVEHALRLGYLKPGDQLPKVRDVVASLAINPNTVSKAYRELETKGLIVGRPGQGTFILATLSQVALPELTGIRRSLHGWLAKADTAGLDESGIAALFASELRDFYERRSAASGGAEGVA